MATGLGREEGLLNLDQVLPGHAAPRVLDDQVDRRAVAGSPDRQLVARPGRVSGIAHEVKQELLDIRLNAVQGGQIVRDLDDQADASPLDALPEDRQSTVGGAVQGHGATVAGVAPGDVEHPAEDPAANLDRVLDLGEILGDDRRLERPLLDLGAQLLDDREHGPQRVIHVMGDSPGKVGHRMLALGDQHALLE